MAIFGLWGNKPIKLTDGDFWRSWFGVSNHTNQAVNSETALRLDAVWACVKLISEITGSLPLHVYEKATNETADGYALYDLLHDEPNADNTAVEFWEGVTLSLLMSGNAFSEIKRSGERITALVPLHPDCVTVKRQGTRNARVYEVREGTKTRTLQEKDMFHVRGLSYGGDVGLSPIEYARNTLGGAMAAEQTSGKMFASGMNAAGILSSDQVLTAEQRKQIQGGLEGFKGSKNAGGVAVLEAGFKYQQLTMKPEDAQMLESRKFSIEQICRMYGVPPIMIGHAADGVTTWGSGIESLLLQFNKSALLPHLRRIEAAIRRDLMTAEDRKRYAPKFAVEGFLRGDSAARASFLDTMVSGGIYTQNEARAYENMPRMDGGDILVSPGTQTQQPEGN